MKVTDKEREASAEMAAWLGFLRKAKRVTLQSIAETHGTHRGNLSAFISSKGTTRNVSMDKLRMVLFDLGLLDGGMLAPGLHRWEVDDEMVDSLCELLNKSAFERGYVFRLGNGLRAFAVVQVCEANAVFASLPVDSVKRVAAGLRPMQGGQPISLVDLDRAGDAQIQALWQTPAEASVFASIQSLWTDEPLFRLPVLVKAG
ncbi:TPA: hypothetical protein ACUB7F_001813 [Pseudomonas aeruginosa]